MRRAARVRPTSKGLKRTHLLMMAVSLRCRPAAGRNRTSCPLPVTQMQCYSKGVSCQTGSDGCCNGEGTGCLLAGGGRCLGGVHIELYEL